MSKLPNAPLLEVIFEIRWSLQPGHESGQVIDEGFELAPGRLSTIVESEFPLHKRIVPLDFPEQLLHYRPVHQYWTGENTWPVLQLGPGIFTINCTDKNYDWENGFRQLISKAIDWLLISYKRNLNIRFVSLKYIDAIKVNEYGGVEQGWKDFIKKNFNFEYNNNFNTKGREKQIQLNQTFELTEGSDLQIQLASGTKGNEKAFIWQTAIIKKASLTTEEIFTWADYAHGIAHDLFQEMIKPNVYASFNNQN